MILTTCAACAAPLAHNAPRCVRCKMRYRWYSALVLNLDTSATLDDLRESVTTLEDVERTARRVLGSAHPIVAGIGINLRSARGALGAREAREI